MNINKFFECLIPFNYCNLKCEYCYLAQQGRYNKKNDTLSVPIEEVFESLNNNRIGINNYFNLCATGETMAWEYIPQLVSFLLSQGQFVSITTNGTLNKSFINLINAITEEHAKRLHFAFSLHYIELKNKKLLDNFVHNVLLVKNFGCSLLIQFNLCDAYIPFLEEIENYCLNNFGILPQIATTRRSTIDGDYELFSKLSKEQYRAVVKKFNSPLFEYTLDNFNMKNNAFCYAGAWSYVLNIGIGELSQCYGRPLTNIYKDKNSILPYAPVGKTCNSKYCVNSSHFKTLGVMPSVEEPTYLELRMRKSDWYSEDMQIFLKSKLKFSNKQLTKKEQLIYGISVNIKKIKNKIARTLMVKK